MQCVASIEKCIILYFKSKKLNLHHKSFSKICLHDSHAIAVKVWYYEKMHGTSDEFDFFSATLDSIVIIAKEE